VRQDVCERIGHGGASALAPGNTLASFDAARDVGVDMIEFDVRGWRGELVLAHTVLHARRGGNATLAQALSHLSARRFGDIGLNVDVKHVGCERALLDALRDAGLLHRTLISSQVPAVLLRVRALEPTARLGVSIGGRLARLSRRWRDWRAHVLAGLASGRWEALMAQHRLIDCALLDDVLWRHGRLYAWTVNERSAIDRLRALGVHGIATADPRLFA
jgi:glycerophosphoryl diester phosphodiesterase